MLAYWDLLYRWNRKINLTSLPEGDEAVDRLLIEPVLAARYLRAGELAVVDVGSGGGSPAIPLKLAAPGIRLTMVESKTRKAAFLREAVRQLVLENVTVETSRYEELLARPDLHEAADVVTVRAVRLERRNALTLQAFLRAGGELFWFTSRGGQLNSLPPLAYDGVHPLLDELATRLVVLRKVGVGA